MSAAKREGQGAVDIGARLTYLFENVHPEGRGPYTNAEVAEGSGVKIGTIKALRAGRQDNPTVHTLTAIAGFFGAPPEVFVSEHGPEYVLARQQLHGTMIDAGVLRLAMRAGGLDAENMRFLTQVIDKARAAQGLEPANGGLDLSM